MNELIFEELRYDFEEKIKEKGQAMKDQCY